ncbi:flagellar hook-length control protein FliK [Bacillus sp. T3]|uniref:flagellar hook-length control protein FliK n=1 Tax=Bacillus sp. T3 TaxID=467262 RepID=UPI002981AFF0|nr:flagellar hook-length control protein FliK [Bacillus sp. T3]
MKIIDRYQIDHGKLDSPEQFMVKFTNSQVVEPLINADAKTLIAENQQKKIVLPNQMPLKAHEKINTNTSLEGYSPKADIDESVTNLFVQEGQVYNDVRDKFSKTNHTPVQVELLTDSAPEEQLITGGLLHKIQTVQKESTSEVIPSSRVLSVNDFVPEVSEWIGRFVKVSHGISGSSEAKFLLNPEHLGRLEIKITSQQGHIAAQIFTDTAAAKETLEGQISVLKQALQQQGLQVQKVEIVQQIPGTFDVNQGNQSFPHGGNNQHFNQSTEQGAYTPSDGSKNRSEDDAPIQIELGKRPRH